MGACIKHPRKENIMKFYIHQNTINSQKSESGKAIYLTHSYDLGFHEIHHWFPLSQLTISEPNECGWAEVEIPDWILKQKHLLGYCNTLKGCFLELEMHE